MKKIFLIFPLVLVLLISHETSNNNSGSTNTNFSYKQQTTEQKTIQGDENKDEILWGAAISIVKDQPIQNIQFSRNLDYIKSSLIRRQVLLTQLDLPPPPNS